MAAVTAQMQGMFMYIGISEIMAEIWFPPQMTSMAPTSTLGEAMPISTPMEHEIAIEDSDITKDSPALDNNAVDGTPAVAQSTAMPVATAIRLAIATQRQRELGKDNFPTFNGSYKEQFVNVPVFLINYKHGKHHCSQGSAYACDDQ